MMRALSDQMEPMDVPQVAELKEALRRLNQRVAEWQLKAGVELERAERADAEVARLRDLLTDVYRVWVRDGSVSSAVIDDVRAALANGGGDGG